MNDIKVEKLSNEQLDLVQLISFKILNKIGSGENLNYFEKTASDLIEKINEVKSSRLFEN